MCVFSKYPLFSTLPRHEINLACSQNRTQSLFTSLGERERRLDSIEARGGTWEGAKEKWRLTHFASIWQLVKVNNAINEDKLACSHRSCIGNIVF